MEIGLHKLLDFFRLILDILTKRFVVERTELGNDSVNHGLTKYAFFLKSSTLTFQAISRIFTLT